jgi:hypothetical protein
LSLDGNASLGQDQWRWCKKCEILCFDNYASCTAGGAHINVGSGKYILAQNDTGAGGQDNWRWCSKCYGLAYAGSASPGTCPKTGVHNHVGSGNYVLQQGSLPGTQDKWKWCHKCQLLWYSGNGQQRCPQGPIAMHDSAGSGNYAIELS